MKIYLYSDNNGAALSDCDVFLCEIGTAVSVHMIVGVINHAQIVITTGFVMFVEAEAPSV